MQALEKKYGEVTTRLATGKAVPLYKLCWGSCTFALVWKASTYGPRRCCHQTPPWSAHGSCLLLSQALGFNYFILGL